MLISYTQYTIYMEITKICLMATTAIKINFFLSLRSVVLCANSKTHIEY